MPPPHTKMSHGHKYFRHFRDTLKSHTAITPRHNPPQIQHSDIYHACHITSLHTEHPWCVHSACTSRANTSHKHSTHTLHIPSIQLRVGIPRFPNSVCTHTGHSAQINTPYVCVEVPIHRPKLPRVHTRMEQDCDLKLLTTLMFSEADHTQVEWLPRVPVPGDESEEGERAR